MTMATSATPKNYTSLTDVTHFHWAGGVPRLLRELRENLVLDAVTITGETIGAIADAAEDIPGQAII